LVQTSLGADEIKIPFPWLSVLTGADIIGIKMAPQFLFFQMLKAQQE
jgi:hypothetical protein